MSKVLLAELVGRVFRTRYGVNASRSFGNELDNPVQCLQRMTEGHVMIPNIGSLHNNNYVRKKIRT